jgi:hypothetical protein
MIRYALTHSLQFDAFIILLLVGGVLYFVYPSLRPVLPTRIFLLAVFLLIVISLTIFVLTGRMTL